MRCAVIITTYNRPDALAAVLHGYALQDDPEFELIVADDGSTNDTRLAIDAFRSQYGMPVKQVWQADRGFRAAAVRNRALAVTDVDYVIFTDGDCVPSRGFVGAHKQLAEPGCFLAANRVLLSEAFTRRVLAEGLPIHTWGWPQWVLAWARRDVNRLLPLLRLRDGGFRRRRPRQWEGVKTCNLSAWRSDLLRVNGLDETYSGWGLEDSDLVIRLLRAGVSHKSARFAAPVLHLWHRENDRSRLADNQQQLATLLRSDRVRARIGLDRYFSAEAPE